MGFELTQKILRNRLPISASEKFLLAMIADRIDHKGYCYPSHARLAAESGLHRATVIRSLAVLQKMNLLFVVRIAGTQNEYKIIEDVLDKLIHEGGGVAQYNTLKKKSANPEGTQEEPKTKQEKSKTKHKKPKSVSKGKLGGSTVQQGMSHDDTGGCSTVTEGVSHGVTLINKTINKSKKKVKKAKPSPIAKTKLKVDGVELVEGESVLIGVDVGNGDSFSTYQVQSGKEPVHHFDKYSKLIESFGHIKNGESSSFIYHLLEAVETLEGGQCYNVVTEHVPKELIDKCLHWLEHKGFKTDYLHFKDQYIKIYKPKQNSPITHTIPSMHLYDAENKSMNKLGEAFQVPASLIGGHVHVDLEAGKKAKFHIEGQEMDVDDIKNLVVKGKTNLKPAKATPISAWRLAVLEWRNENDVKGDLMKSTQKDAGMLNQAKKKYGVGFEYAMTHTVLQWDKFVTYANMNTGGKSKPAQPSISYFVLCIENVRLFLNKKSDTKVKLKQPTKLKITKKVLKDGKLSKTQQLLAAVKAQEETDES